MHPALSIVAFTTFSGAGYGLLAGACLLLAFGQPPARPLLLLVPALALVTIGLLASVGHLARPERAWRAFSQWRTSWLSREGVMALVTYAASAPLLLLWGVYGRTGVLERGLSLLVAVLAMLTVACSGMIYASIKPVRQWRSPFTVPSYLALAAMTGLLGLDALLPGGFPAVTITTILLAWALKEAYWRGTGPGVSTVTSATGLTRFGQTRLFEAPHTESNYLLREMGFRLARKHGTRLRLLARLLGFALPLLLTLAGVTSLAALSAFLGVLCERWLFFAEARHTVMLYYGAETA